MEKIKNKTKDVRVGIDGLNIAAILSAYSTQQTVAPTVAPRLDESEHAYITK
jgi:hypothetical protein